MAGPKITLRSTFTFIDINIVSVSKNKADEPTKPWHKSGMLLSFGYLDLQ